MEQFSISRLFRNKQTGATSRWIRDVIPETVTLDSNYLLPRSDQGLWKTVFKEVEIVPGEETLTAAQHKLLNREAKTTDATLDEFFEHCVEETLKFMEQAWSPTKFHLIYSSSGWDSRFIGCILRILCERLGRVWLGELLFVCLGREGPTFRKLMKREGWDRADWTHLADEGAHFEWCLSFENASNWVNGVSPSFFNLNYVLGARLQEMGLVPEDDNAVQLVSGFGSDYHLIGAGASLGNGLRDRLKKAYRGSISISPFKFDDVLYPMINYGMVRVVIDSKHRLAYELRKELVDHVDRNVRGLPRCDPKPALLPASLFNQMIKDYEHSWYGREVEPLAILGATAENRFDPWWMHWSMAAFCEGLLRKGYVIDVQ